MLGFWLRHVNWILKETIACVGWVVLIFNRVISKRRILACYCIQVKEIWNLKQVYRTSKNLKKNLGEEQKDAKIRNNSNLTTPILRKVEKHLKILNATLYQILCIKLYLSCKRKTDLKKLWRVWLINLKKKKCTLQKDSIFIKCLLNRSSITTWIPNLLECSETYKNHYVRFIQNNSSGTIIK